MAEPTAHADPCVTLDMTAQKITSPDDPALDELCDALAELAGEVDLTGQWPTRQLQLCGDYGVYEWFIGMYGFWLPNDERGSWSDFVGSWELLRFGKAKTVQVRQSLARRPFDPARRAAAQAALKYPPVKLNGVQARAPGRGTARRSTD